MEKVLKTGQKTTIISALVTIFLATLKGLIGFFSGSVVLIADAIHSAADSLSSLTAWVGLKIAQKKPSEKFPYGYYKAENLAALLISGLILFAGITIIRDSVEKITTQYELGIPFIAIGAAVLDALVMYFIGNYEIKVGKKINSQSLVADGKESKMHIFTSAVVVIGLVSSLMNISFLEGIMGIIISLFIFQAGLESLRDSIFALMDVSPDKEKELKIREFLKKCSEIQNFEDLKLRSAGPFIFGEAKVRIAESVDIKRASETVEVIQGELRKKFPEVDSFALTVLPSEIQNQKIAIPIKDNQGLDSRVSRHFGKGLNFIFISLDKSEIKDYYVKENPYYKDEKKVGVNTASFLVKEKITSVIVFELGPSPLHTLRDKKIDVYRAVDGSAGELIDKLKNKQLKIIKESIEK